MNGEKMNKWISAQLPQNSQGILGIGEGTPGEHKKLLPSLAEQEIPHFQPVAQTRPREGFRAQALSSLSLSKMQKKPHLPLSVRLRLLIHYNSSVPPFYLPLGGQSYPMYSPLIS